MIEYSEMEPACECGSCKQMPIGHPWSLNKTICSYLESLSFNKLTFVYFIKAAVLFVWCA